MLEFIKENIVWIKDIVTLIFAGTATIIGILTYRRARKTLLQPIRNEVIKKQSEQLTQLLEYLQENGPRYENTVDYLKIVQINTFKILQEYGFVFKEHNKLFEELDKEIVGWIPCGRSKLLKDVEIVGTFSSGEKVMDVKQIEKEKFENLKKGKIEIEKIYQTKSLQLFINEVSSFSKNPFMPNSIQEVLNELNTQIHHNITMILKSELENFMLKFSEEYFLNSTAPNFDTIGIYNDFNHKRFHHRNSMNKVRKEIRKYLLIDEPW